MKTDPALTTSLQQRQAQLPRLAARLLKLNSTQLALELAGVAEQNPLLEITPAALPALPAPGPSLRAHLLGQLTGIADRRLRLDAVALAGEVDANGRLPDVATLCRQLGLSAARIKAALARVQKLDPIGVGACDLRECLLLQLAGQPDSDVLRLAQTIVRDHFAQLSRRRYDQLPQLRLAEVLRLIASLNPRPGAGFSQEAATAAPEIQIRKSGGLWRVELLADEMPATIATGVAGGTRQFRRLARQARVLAESLSFRRRTLLAVAAAATARQRLYCERGAAFLRPLGLQQVAEDTGLAVSTVSTAVAGKLVRGPHGVIALKYLFQRSTCGRRDFSAAALQMAIRQVVAGENPARPLSDAAIAARLAAAGGAPARRTVAKHRAASGIAAASLRKRPLETGVNSL
ncbi:MAG: hypothetical protein OXC81_05385 [Betaproteobacteria bacterium]|nr:hypothetical protein [Betaproteobacteria bacterium]